MSLRHGVQCGRRLIEASTVDPHIREHASHELAIFARWQTLYEHQGIVGLFDSSRPFPDIAGTTIICGDNHDEIVQEIVPHASNGVVDDLLTSALPKKLGGY